MYLSFWRVYFSCSFLLRTSDISPESAGSAFLLTTVQRFCSMLFTGPPRALANKSAHLFTPAAVLKLKIPFQISSDEKALFLGAKGSGQSFGFFLPHLYFIWATTMTYIPFSVQPIIGYGVLVVLFDQHSECLSGRSLGLVSSNTEE